MTRARTPRATPLSTMSGPECCENPPKLASGGESGDVVQIASLNSYVSGNADSKIAVLLVSDVFGYEAPKLRKLADKVASAGYYVVVPDFFHGDPVIPGTSLQDWLKNHEPLEAVEFAKSVIKALKEKGVSKIGAAGFCWGAKVVVELAKEAEIQVAALLHPSFVTLDDLKGVKVSTGIFGAEIDKMCPPEVVKEFELCFRSKTGAEVQIGMTLDVAGEEVGDPGKVGMIDHFVKIYNGVSHGWTTRWKDDDEIAMQCAKEALEDLLAWFGKCL
ncbi:hypothetical protein L2E82_03803 [Cichorium intybus]|uniref:Uncharacterized protein n=1 Tax=Cichorium intybus TaxID=13427 RepID=A0ACB9H515_CICIN|nr:hypothetical protein L2E82_03803 [Cichorium intybus]